MINEKSSAAKPVLIFVILLVIIMALGAIVYLTMFKNPSPIAVQPTVNPKTTTMPDIDIADWQIYRNEKYRFEVKYPQDFEGEEPESGDVLLGAEKTEGGSSYYLTIKVRPNYKVDQIVSSVKDAEKITIGDHPGYKYFYTEGIGESGVALIQIGQDELSIIFDSIGNGQNFANAGDRKIYVQNMLDQILSTLKFTEKDETADWKVYRNEEYGFEFKYPASWDIQDKSSEKFEIYSLYLDQSNISANPILQITKNPGGIGYEFLDFYLSESVKIGEITTQKRFFKPTESWFGKCDKRQTQGGFHILFNKEKDEYEILATYCQSTDVFNPSIFDEILSTFKFIEKDETADWKVYRNEEYGIEFEYPKDFELKEHIFESTGQDWDGSKINKLAIFDLFDENNMEPIINPSLRISITAVPYNDVIQKYKEMEKIKSGNNFIEKQNVFKIGEINGTELNSYVIIPINNYTIIFDKTFKNTEVTSNQILSTFKFTEQ